MASPTVDITAEVHFAQRLAANDKKTRDRAIRRLKKWIEAKSSSKNDFTEDDLLKLWKGLFYCMWMSDKPLVQEELSRSISQLLFSFQEDVTAFLFIDTFFVTIAREWYGIDRWRMDKFMMMVRTFLNRCLEYIKKFSWQKEHIEKFSSILRKTPLTTDQTAISVPLGLQLHMADIYVEELARVAADEVTPELVNLLLEPYCLLLVETKDATLLKNIVYRVFEFAMRISDIELIDEAEEPTEESDSVLSDSVLSDTEDKQNEGQLELSQAEESENTANTETLSENSEKRKKKKKKAKVERVSYRRLVDTKTREAMEMPYIKFEYSSLADHLFSLASQPQVKHRNRVVTYRLVNKFRELAQGIFPLDRHFPKEGTPLTREDIEEAAMRLNAEDEKVCREKLLRKRKRKLPKQEESDEDSDADLLGEDDELEPLLEDDGNAFERRSFKSAEITTTETSSLKSVTATETSPRKPVKNKSKKLKKSDSEDLPSLKEQTRSLLESQDSVVASKLSPELSKTKFKKSKKGNAERLPKTTCQTEKIISPSSLQTQVKDNINKSPIDENRTENAETYKLLAFDERKVEAEKVEIVHMKRKKTQNAVVSKKRKRKFRKRNSVPIATQIDNPSPLQDVTLKKVSKMEVLANVAQKKVDTGPSSKTVKTSRPEKAIVHVESSGESRSLEKLWKRPPAFLRKVISKLAIKDKLTTKDKPKKEIMKKKKLKPKQKFQVSAHASKKVNFALFKNIAHEHKDYQTSLQDSPSVPFDSKKQPSQGVLKPVVQKLRAADFFDM